MLLFLPMDIQAKDLNEFRQRLGFNDPLPVQYGALHVAARSAATSASRCATSRMPSVSSSSACPPPSAWAVVALLLTFCVAIPVGVVSAMKRGSVWDYLGMGGAVLGQAIPGFWLGLMLIYSLLGAPGLAAHRRAPAAPSTT